MTLQPVGTLWLVGVGPGDPDLLTLRAVRVLSNMRLIAFPATSAEASFARDIAQAHLRPDAELLPVTIPMVVDRGPAQAAYDEATEDIIAYLQRGHDAAWLCEGDPLFYGSAMYLMARVGQHAPVRIVPGITSVSAAAAAIGRPLAARDEILKVLPATLPDDVLRPELESTPAAAIIKIGRHFDRIRGLLNETGHGRNAVIIEYATTPRQRITPLKDFAYGERPYFSTILCSRGNDARG